MLLKGILLDLDDTVIAYSSVTGPVWRRLCLEWDVGAPQKPGIFGIWNDYDKKGLPSDSDIIPDRIIHSISELVRLKT